MGGGVGLCVGSAIGLCGFGVGVDLAVPDDAVVRSWRCRSRGTGRGDPCRDVVRVCVCSSAVPWSLEAREGTEWKSVNELAYKEAHG